MSHARGSGLRRSGRIGSAAALGLAVVPLLAGCAGGGSDTAWTYGPGQASSSPGAPARAAFTPPMAFRSPFPTEHPDPGVTVPAVQRKGDCWRWTDNAVVRRTYVKVVCSAAHTDEVFGGGRLAESDYRRSGAPDAGLGPRDWIARTAGSLCQARFHPADLAPNVREAGVQQKIVFDSSFSAADAGTARVTCLLEQNGTPFVQGRLLKG